jgi:hypothetical protein
VSVSVSVSLLAKPSFEVLVWRTITGRKPQLEPTKR